MKRLWLLLALLAAVSLACSFGASVAPSANAPAPTKAPPTQNPILFQDNFSDPTSGWDRVKSDSGSLTDYVDGHYRILVNEANSDVWANPGEEFSGPIVITVDAVKNGGPDDNDFGVLCRYKDENNYYFFVISSDGYAGIGRVVDGQQTILTGNGKMVPSDKLPKDPGVTYHIKATCIDKDLTLYVNGKKIASTKDGTLTSGDIGLMAGTFDTPGTDILFDNVVVRRP